MAGYFLDSPNIRVYVKSIVRVPAYIPYVHSHKLGDIQEYAHTFFDKTHTVKKNKAVPVVTMTAYMVVK